MESMQKRSSRHKHPNQTDALTTQGSTEKEPEKNPAAVALGRLGGLKGGKARASKLSAERRKEIAQNAAKARWAYHTKRAEQ